MDSMWGSLLTLCVLISAWWRESHGLPIVAQNDFMVNKAFKTVTDYYELDFDDDMVWMGEKLIPRQLHQLYGDYRGENFPVGEEFANTVHSIKTEVALVNDETMFVFNLTSVSRAEAIIRGDLHLNRQHRRKRRLLYMTLYEVAPYYITRIVTYALDDYRRGQQYVPVTDALKSCMASRQGEPHIFALGFSKNKKNGKMKDVHVDRFLRLYSTPLLFVYTNSSANVSRDFLEPHLKPDNLEGSFVNPKTGERVEYDLYPDNDGKEETTTTSTPSPTSSQASTTTEPATTTTTQTAQGPTTSEQFTPFPRQPMVYPPHKDFKWKVIKQTFSKDSLKTYYKYPSGASQRTKRDSPVLLEGQVPKSKLMEEERRSNKIMDVFERYKDADYLFESDYGQLLNSDSQQPATFGSGKNQKQYLPTTTKDSNAKNNLLPLTWPSVKPEEAQPTESPKRDSCGVKPFDLSFADIGWEDRVVAPAAVPFNYCSGRCNSVPNLLRGQSNHAILQALAHTIDSPKGMPSPCCMPDGFSPATVLYLDDYGNYVLKTYPRMTVTSCGCS